MKEVVGVYPWPERPVINGKIVVQDDGEEGTVNMQAGGEMNEVRSLKLLASTIGPVLPSIACSTLNAWTPELLDEITDPLTKHSSKIFKLIDGLRFNPPWDRTIESY